MGRWESVNNKYLLDVLGDDPLAAKQSVAMYLDPVAKCIEWHTNGHIIRLRPDLPSAIVSGPFQTSFGYEWNLAGGLVFGVGDVSLTKRAGILDQWGLQGVQIYYIVPVGQIPQTPIVKIEKIDILDGMIDSLTLSPQGVLSAEDIAAGGSRPDPWVDNSMPLFWKNKQHNNSSDNHSNYMTGKILHEAPPLAHPLVCDNLQAGSTANRSFSAANGSETTGWYEVLSGGFQKAYNLQDLIDRRGVGTHYAFAATLGWTTIGASQQTANVNRLWFMGDAANENGWTATEDGTVDTFSVLAWGQQDFTAFAWTRALYIATGGPPDPTATLIANSESSIAPTRFTFATGLNEYDYTGAKPTFLSGDKILLVVHDENIFTDVSYDTVSPGADWLTNDYAYGSALPTPYNLADAITNLARRVGVYISYTPAGAAGKIPQIMHHRQNQRSR